MNCPRCGNDLTEVSKHGVTIDVCSSCGGMWLDKGELAKITAQMREAEASLDRELAGGREHVREPVLPNDPYRQPDYRYEREQGYHHHDEYKRHKKKSRFESLFDIFD
jgi:uncharacterized protein